MGSRRIADSDILDALMVTRTDTEAAERLGCARETISRRRAKPEFQAKLEAARAERHRRIADRVEGTLDAAVIRVAQVLAEDSLNHGLTAWQLITARQRSMQLLKDFSLGLRAANRDDQLRQLEEEMRAARSELAMLRELILGVSADGKRHAPA